MKLKFQSFPAYLILIILVAIAYGCTGWLTLSAMGLRAEASAIWFPAGIALAVLLLWGEKLWWGIFLGDFCLMLTLGVSWRVAFGSALGSSLAAFVGAKLLREVKFSPSLARIGDVIALVLLGAMFAPILKATIDSLIQLVVGKLIWQNFWQQWWILWLGDCSGILVITPFLFRLKFNSVGLWKRKLHPRLIEALFCAVLLLGISWEIFVHNGLGIPNTQYLEYLPFPFVVWAAIRFQTWGAVMASLLVCFLAIAGTLQGVGPFIIQTDNAYQGVILLQSFIIIITVTALVLSAAISERQRAEKELKSTLERDRLLAEVALRIRESLQLKQIFQTTVIEIRDLLQVDRVYIGYLKTDYQAEVMAESVGKGYASLLGWIPPDQLLNDIKELFTENNIFVFHNITQAHLSRWLRKYYQKFQVKAALIMPLKNNNKPLGVIGIHQCSGIRHWTKNEVKLLEQLATQVTIAMKQAQLYQQIQDLNSNLEKQVKERTLELQEKVQEVQELCEMKTVFLQAVSHDFRTSIMGLLMILKKLQNCPDNNLSISRVILEKMIQSNERQLLLINALSEDHFSEDRKIMINCQPLSLKELVDHILKNLQVLIVQNQAKVNNLIPGNLPLINADSGQINQVFENLLNNALKHNPPGIKLTLNASLDNDMIRCTLTDDGVGMEECQCEQLFKIYVRNLYNQRLTGIGLGCYQCRQIIEAHGGKISVNSTPGIGSQFWFTLPLANIQNLTPDKSKNIFYAASVKNSEVEI